MFLLYSCNLLKPFQYKRQSGTMYSYYFINWGCIGLFYYYLLPEMIIECSPSLLDAHYDFKSSVKKHILTQKIQ